MKIEIFRDLTKGYSDPDQVVEIGDEIPCRVTFLLDGDKSDPLNKMKVVGFKCGERLGGRIAWDTEEGQDFHTTIDQLAAAVRVLFIYAIDNAAELRDHLKVGQ